VCGKESVPVICRHVGSTARIEARQCEVKRWRRKRCVRLCLPARTQRGAREMASPFAPRMKDARSAVAGSRRAVWCSTPRCRQVEGTQERREREQVLAALPACR